MHRDLLAVFWREASPTSDECHQLQHPHNRITLKGLFLMNIVAGVEANNISKGFATIHGETTLSVP